MKSVISYKSEIAGYRDISVTTKTTEKIAATYIHLYEKYSVELDRYILTIKQQLEILQDRTFKFRHKLLEIKQEDSKASDSATSKAILIVTGNKGLVGGLWHNIVNTLLEYKKDYNLIFVIGQKGIDFLEEEEFTIYKSFIPENDIISKEYITEVEDILVKEYLNKTFTKLDILYPKFISLELQQPKVIQYLPFTFSQSKKNVNFDSKYHTKFYNYEPSKKEIFGDLFEKYIKAFFLQIIIESQLAEFSARIVSMESASNQIEKKIKSLQLAYIKNKHAMITENQLRAVIAHKLTKVENV